MIPEDDTIVTPILRRAADNWRSLVPWVGGGLIAIASSLISVSAAIGHRQADEETLVKNVAELTLAVKNGTTEMKTEINEIRGEVRKVSDSQLEMKGDVKAVSGDISDLKGWKNQVTGVAESTSIPKLQGHRAQHK